MISVTSPEWGKVNRIRVAGLNGFGKFCEREKSTGRLIAGVCGSNTAVGTLLLATKLLGVDHTPSNVPSDALTCHQYGSHDELLLSVYPAKLQSRAIFN